MAALTSVTRIPILGSGLPKLSPGVSLGTYISAKLSSSLSSSVVQTTQYKSATPAALGHIFSPLITHSSPSRRARVRIVLARSAPSSTLQPPAGSVMAIQPTRGVSVANIGINLSMRNSFRAPIAAARDHGVSKLCNDNPASPLEISSVMAHTVTADRIPSPPYRSAKPRR